MDQSYSRRILASNELVEFSKRLAGLHGVVGAAQIRWDDDAQEFKRRCEAIREYLVDLAAIAECADEHAADVTYLERLEGQERAHRAAQIGGPNVLNFFDFAAESVRGHAQLITIDGGF